MDRNLTKAADLLAVEIYAEYLNRLEDGISRSEAKHFMNHSVYQLLPKISEEDAREILNELLDQFPPKYSYVHDFEISAEFISYMEGRFERKLNKILEYAAKIRATLIP